MSNFKLISLNTRMATTEEDNLLPAFDHTALSAVNTCPTWGVIRYRKHKKMPGSERQMALEAGGAAHECFAAIKWWQFYSRQCRDNEILNRVANTHGIRLFGTDRFNQMLASTSNSATDRTNLINFSTTALELSDFYDDINDTRRTISNISESIVYYIDRYDMDRCTIWIRDESDPLSDVGIEIPYNIVARFEYGTDLSEPNETCILTCRFTGVLDGLLIKNKRLRVREEKTAARPDEAWLAQWITSHQITGYTVAASTFTQEECFDAEVSGMRIPIGRDPSTGIRVDDVRRTPYMVEKWAEWFVHSAGIMLKYQDTPLEAPMYTHSCNRYFRSCSFLPLCASPTLSEKEDVLAMMEEDEWNPLT